MGLRQLIPLPRDYLDIVKYEKAPVDKEKSWRTGSLKPVGKEKVSPWDLIEGLKNTYPLSLSWFGASRSPRLPQHWQYRVRMVVFDLEKNYKDVYSGRVAGAFADGKMARAC